MENPGNQSGESPAPVEDPPPSAVVQDQSTSESFGDSSGQQQQLPEQQRRPAPPLSPLTGCYLLIVIGEPHSERHKEIILQRIAKAFLSWDVSKCHVSLEKELQVITSQSPEGEEARYGERLIQYATENLVTEILIHPQLNTLHQCMKNLLSSFTKHRHIIHAGYTFAGNGSWILQDGTWSVSDLVEALHEQEVLRVLKAYENSVSIDVHCAAEGDWTTERFQKEFVSKLCNIRINPGDIMTAGDPAMSAFVDYLCPFLEPANIQQLLQPTDVVGNIRFTHPTLYVFPGGQGDAALFGINGFNMLIDGGFARKACFWDFARHLDRLDAVLLTRLNNSTVNGISAVLQRKKMNHVYPQIGHFFCNLQDRKIALSPDGDKDKDSLIVNLAEEGQEIVANLRHLALKPHPCYRDGNQVDPVNLYHKVGHGKLDMYVISPARDSQAVKEFLAKWSSNDSHLFSNTGKKVAGKAFEFPLQNLVSICALLVWQPANPSDTITRILFPGSTPQHKIFEGLEKLKHLEFLKHPVCSAKSISPSASTLTFTRSVSKSRQPRAFDNKQKEAKVVSKPQPKQVKPKMEKPTFKETKTKLDTNKLIEEKKELEKATEESLKKLDNRVFSKDEQIENIKTEIHKIELAENEEQKKKVTHKSKYDMRYVKSKVDSRAPSRSVDRKKLGEKKNEGEVSPPGTPKKSFTNGTATKGEKAKLGTVKPVKAVSPPSTPAKSAKEANNRKVVEARGTPRSMKTAPRKKEDTPPPPAAKSTDRKPISRRPKASLSPIKSMPLKSVKVEPEFAIKKVEIPSEFDTAAVKVGEIRAVETLEGAENKTEIEKGDNFKIEMKKLKEETTENKETEKEAVKIDFKIAQNQESTKMKEEEEEEEEEEYLIVTKEEVSDESIKGDESGKESLQDDVQTEGEGEIKKLLREEKESEKQREIENHDQEKAELGEMVEKRGISEDEEKKENDKTNPEEKESELQKLMEADEGVDLKEPVSKDHKEGESLPEEKISNTIETSATTAPTLPEDERMEVPTDEEEKNIPEETKEIIEEKYIQEKTKEEKKQELEVERKQPLVPKTLEKIKVEGEPVVTTQKKHPRDVVKTPDEVADLPMHEEVDPRMYSNGEFAKDLQKKTEESKNVEEKTKKLPDGFSAGEEKEADLLEDEISAKLNLSLQKHEKEKESEGELEKSVTSKYLDIIDELEKSSEEQKKEIFQKSEKQNAKFNEKLSQNEDISNDSNNLPKMEAKEMPAEELLASQEAETNLEPVKKSFESRIETSVDSKEDAEKQPNEQERKESQILIKETDNETFSADFQKNNFDEFEADSLVNTDLEKNSIILCEPKEKSGVIDESEINIGKGNGDDASGKKDFDKEENSQLIKINIVSQEIDSAEKEKFISSETPSFEKRIFATEHQVPKKKISAGLEESISEKCTPAFLKQSASEKSTPSENENLSTEKISPSDSKMEDSRKDVSQNIEESFYEKIAEEEIQTLLPEKIISEREGKAASGKSSPFEVQTINEKFDTDLDKQISGVNLQKEEEKTISGKSTPQELEKPVSKICTPQEIENICHDSEKRIPDTSVFPDKSKSTEEEKVTNDLKQQKLSEKNILYNAEKDSLDSRPLKMHEHTPDKIPLTDLEKSLSRQGTPENEEKSTNKMIEEKESQIACPEENEESKISRDGERNISRQSTPQDLGNLSEKFPSEKTSPLIEEKIVLENNLPLEQASATITPTKLDQEVYLEDSKESKSGDTIPQGLEKIRNESSFSQELGKTITEKSKDLEKVVFGKSTSEHSETPKFEKIISDNSEIQIPQDFLTSSQHLEELKIFSDPDKDISEEINKENLGEFTSQIHEPQNLEKKDIYEKSVLEEIEERKNETYRVSSPISSKIQEQSSPDKSFQFVLENSKNEFEKNKIDVTKEKDVSQTEDDFKEGKTKEEKKVPGKEIMYSVNVTESSKIEIQEKDKTDKKISGIETSVSDSTSSGCLEKDVSGKSTPYSTDKETSGKISSGVGGKLTSDSYSQALAEKGTSGTYSLEKENFEKGSSPSPVDISPLSLDEIKDVKGDLTKTKELHDELEFGASLRGSVVDIISSSPVKTLIDRIKYEDRSSSGASSPDKSNQEALPNGGESEEELEKGTLESERQEKEFQNLDLSSEEEEELKALGDDEEDMESDLEMRKEISDIKGSSVDQATEKDGDYKEFLKGEKEDINNLVKIGENVEQEETDLDVKSRVKRMLITASSEDGGMETEICLQHGAKLKERTDEERKETEDEDKDENETEEADGDGDFTNLILQAQKEYEQRSRKTSCNTSTEELEEIEETESVVGENLNEEEELGTLMMQARQELAFVRSKSRELNRENEEVNENVRTYQTTKTTTRSETTKIDDDDLITITTILTEEREDQEDGRIKITTTTETTTSGGKNEGTVIKVNTNFENQEGKKLKKQEDTNSSHIISTESSSEMQIDSPGSKRGSREDAEGKTSQEDALETSRRTSASSIISQEDLVSRKDSAKIEDFRRSSTEMSQLKTTYITSHGDSESLMTSSFYGNLPTEDEMIERSEHHREFRKGKGYESVTEIGPNGERTERTYFYEPDEETVRPSREKSRFVKAYFTEEGNQKEGGSTRIAPRYYKPELPEEETEFEKTPFVQQFYSEETPKAEIEEKYRLVETSEEVGDSMDFARAIVEHVSVRGEYLGKEYQEDIARFTNGKSKIKVQMQEEDAEEGGQGCSLIEKSSEPEEKKKDVIEEWGKPLKLPLPPKNLNRTYAFPGQNISTTSSLSTPTDNSDSVTNWGQPMSLPSPAPPLSQNGIPEILPGKMEATKETPKKEKKPQPKKNISENNKSSGNNTPIRRSESPVKQTERRALSTGRSPKPGSCLYLDLTYVPHHGNSYYSNVEFFKKVRARYYVFSGTEPSKEVYNALLEAKQTWEDKKLEVTIIPTYDTDVLGYWVAENEEILAKNKIDLSPSASRCTINLQDHETSCSAYRLEF